MRFDVLPAMRRERHAVQAGLFMARADLEKVAETQVSEVLVGQLFDRLLSYLQEGGEVRLILTCQCYLLIHRSYAVMGRHS